MGVALINLCWLLPIAAAVVLQGLNGVLGVIIAYLPLLLIAIRYRAGTEEITS
jgi:Fuc2NAc and GlcNAc transferase